MTAIPDSVRAVLEGPALAHLVTLEPDGRPQVSIVWVGLDALLAIVQMPPGVPVACVGVDNARNAAVLAARILAC